MKGKRERQEVRLLEDVHIVWKQDGGETDDGPAERGRWILLGSKSGDAWS